MAVYTKITEEELITHLNNYDLGQLINYKGIVAGIDNSNYIIETTKGKFIFTIFESRINKNELPFFINLTQHLSQQGICCPNPIADKQNKLLTTFKNKSCVIVTFLSGSTLEPLENGFYQDITPQHCFEIGKITAQMHIAIADFKEKRINDLGAITLRDFYNKFSDKINDYQQGLKEEIEVEIKNIEDSWNINLPAGVIHSDLFPDNVFFKDEISNNSSDIKPIISGVIDFYFAATDLFIFDFACIVNAWCFDENNSFLQVNFDSLIAGYESLRKFSKDEKSFLQIALITASLRFLLTRLHDMIFTPTDSLVKVKNPQEYITKLRFFKNNFHNE